MSTSTSTLKEVAAILSKTKAEINKLLEAKEHHMLLLGLNANLDKMANRVGFLSGTSLTSDQSEKFKPVTNFMGEDISIPKKIDKDEIEPGEADRLIFVDKVERLYAEFLTIPPDGILNSYTLPEDQLVVRGVAKKAGIEGYADREFTVQFLQEIAEGIKTNEAEDAKQKEIDLQLQQLDNQSGADSVDSQDSQDSQDPQVEEKSQDKAEDAKQTKKAGKK